LAGTGNSPPKPIRRRRTDRQEIGFYRFAAQRGCTHITASAATDRPTSYRMKDPARSVALRQQRNLAVRGASSMLEHSALLFRSGRIRSIYRSPLRRDRGFESISLQQGVCKMQPYAWKPANCRPALRRIKIF
jgi:hypothetical protein